MKTIITTIILYIIVTLQMFSQQLTQTVRGAIVDADTKTPLVGAVVAITGTDPLMGTVTDLKGNFRFDNIPVGRITIQVSYLGYEPKTIPNIEVNSGKEAVLNFSLQESVIKIEEVVIKPKRKNGEALNEMALISARSISTEQTKRFAGTWNDPSRILSNFAGVTNTADGSNDIIVRGNSPNYLQWRLEGVEISNPNHFADQSHNIGGFNMLNNSVLSTSDFYTGAFAPEYGNALSGVYDIKLRAGNNEKIESTFGFGITGTDFTVEGPFKKGYSGSYLINYRYSTVALIEKLGLIEDVPSGIDFQDMTVKIVLPTNEAGTFSLFGLGGLNKFNMPDVDGSMLPTPGDKGMRSDIIEDLGKDNYLLNSGLNHTIAINKNSYIRTTLSYATEGIKTDIFESTIVTIVNGDGIPETDTVNRTLNYTSKLIRSTYRGAVTYSYKLNTKNRIQIGTRYSLYAYVNSQSMLNENYTARIALVDFNENIGALGNFVSWKYRLNEDITFVTGIHNLNVLYNNKSTFEPRLAVNWKLNKLNSVHAGYGNHSTMESIQSYFMIVEDVNGTVVEPNKDMDLLKAHHFVVGYEKQITRNLVGKIELYYQHLYNLPVENNDTSFYATINSGDEFRYVDLVNKGTSKNYGIEINIERYFTNSYYFLINASLYESKYKSLEGVWRNTMHNSNYLVNILCGKEFTNLGKKQNKTLGLNAKIFFGGGRKIIPLLRDDQGNLAVEPENNRYWDFDKAYENKIEDNHMVTVSANYKINKPRATHEIKLELQNLTGYRVKITEYYDEDKPGSVGYLAFPVGLFPNLMYRVYF